MIEKVYTFLWGDLIKLPLREEVLPGNLTSDPASDSDRYLFYHQDKASADPSFSGYGTSPVGKEK